jgi:hypothetical protein
MAIACQSAEGQRAIRDEIAGMILCVVGDLTATVFRDVELCLALTMALLRRSKDLNLVRHADSPPRFVCTSDVNARIGNFLFLTPYFVSVPTCYRNPEPCRKVVLVHTSLGFPYLTRKVALWVLKSELPSPLSLVSFAVDISFIDQFLHVSTM